MMGYYLLDHPNPHGPNYYKTRKGSILAGVIHITAGLQDDDGDYRVDTSAEATAKYASTTDRAVSWHSGSDSNSSLLLLPDEYTAFQCIGYNSRTIGHEISKRDIVWADENPEWVRRTLQEAADCLRDRYKKHGIPFRHATKAELDHAIATNGKPVGLVAHAELDPTRRRDPGPDFPWTTFLRMLAGAPAPKPPAPAKKAPSAPKPPTPATPITTEEDMKYQRFIVDGSQQYLVLPEGLVVIKDPHHLGLMKKAGLVADGEPIPVAQADVDAYGLVK